MDMTPTLPMHYSAGGVPFCAVSSAKVDHLRRLNGTCCGKASGKK